MRALLRIFFYLLYHQFAFAYDLVAWLVSFGHWKDWILEVVPFIEGPRTLEIGHGPGRLQRILLNRGLVTVAIDESASMIRLAKRNLHSYQDQAIVLPENTRPYIYTQINSTRGMAQQLPFHDEAFDTVIATFPAEYIYDARTMSEVRRCLSDGGRFIILPVAMPKNRFLSWLFKVTDQAPAEALEIVQRNLEEPFMNTGFLVDTHIIERTSGTLIIIVATKENHA